MGINQLKIVYQMHWLFKFPFYCTLRLFLFTLVVISHVDSFFSLKCLLTWTPSWKCHAGRKSSMTSDPPVLLTRICPSGWLGSTNNVGIFSDVGIPWPIHETSCVIYIQTTKGCHLIPPTTRPSWTRNSIKASPPAPPPPPLYIPTPMCLLSYI